MVATQTELQRLKAELVAQRAKPYQQEDTGAGSIITSATQGYGGEGGGGGDWLGGILGGLTGAAKYMGSSEGRNILAGEAVKRGELPMAGAYLSQAGTQAQKEAGIKQAIAEKEKQRQTELLTLALEEEKGGREELKDILGAKTEVGKTVYGAEAAAKLEKEKEIAELKQELIKRGTPPEEADLISRHPELQTRKGGWLWKQTRLPATQTVAGVQSGARESQNLANR